MLSCPQCGAGGLNWCKGHKVKINGKFADSLVEDCCFNCGYKSKPYSPGLSRPLIIMTSPKRNEKTTKEEKITFTACKGDMEIHIKIGRKGLEKLMSVFMEAE